jgi:uncharacterized membrane protein
MTWKWPEMVEWHPTTNDELHEKQAVRRKMSAILATAYIGTVVVGFACGAFLQIQHRITLSSWPIPLRFFTQPQGTVLVFLGILLVTLKSLPSTRRVEAMRPYSRAIGNYERSQRAFALWEETRKERRLAESFRFIEAAAWALKDVPEFAELRNKIKAALDAGPTRDAR